ncbi:amidase signature domain-containing protein [Clohesyomyces aquaticus]|uniref:Amidase signature domain-containing protein n=1 Tax=Clohesyomyces aquaticus TaxID=1231657 RepID=A0A1Y2AB18_9PLEO|nr:amidase signature domain-containing protein [Clohesyomyces aquaticus]
MQSPDASKTPSKKYKLLHTTVKLPSHLHIYHLWLYYEPNPEKPLLSLRFAVKDVIDIAGLTTSNGSRCWQDVYLPAEESAPFIEQLTNAGAILVGKLNCTQFCDGQDPFEQVSPFNPRGDGYQSPSSSSSGSAAAAAGYNWLDFTIGTDTGGSIRHPAGVNGTYGIRPTFSSVESKGMAASGFMDTVGVFARSASMLERAQKAITSPSETFAQPQGPEARYKLIYLVRSNKADPNDNPKWFPRPGHPNNRGAQAEQIFESVVSKLENHLSCKRQILNLDELWSSTHPDTMDASLSIATGKIYQTLVYYVTATDVIRPFIAKHKADRDGRTPYLEPIFKTRFEYGASVTQHDFDSAVVHFETFKKWLLDVLFASHTDETVILLYPQSCGNPNYRDESKPPPTVIKPSERFWEGFSSYSISYVFGCPDITVPVGQVPYHSRITEHEEWLPISLSFLSQRGNDRILGSLLKELEDTRVLQPVRTGAKAYRG